MACNWGAATFGIFCHARMHVVTAAATACNAGMGAGTHVTLDNAGFGGLYCEGTQQVQTIGQQSHGIVEPGQWAYFTLTLDHKDATWQGGLAVAFLTSNGGYPVVLQKYGGIPTLNNCDSVLR